MLICEPPANQRIDQPLLENIYDSLCDQDVELVFVDAGEIQELNRQYRQVDKVTDVLSFPLEAVEGLPLGSVVICLDVALEKAKELGHSPDHEIALLFVHGLLHLLGFDHESDSGEMRMKEKRLIEQFGLPKSLIVRSEDTDGD